MVSSRVPTRQYTYETDLLVEAIKQGDEANLRATLKLLHFEMDEVHEAIAMAGELGKHNLAHVLIEKFPQADCWVQVDGEAAGCMDSGEIEQAAYLIRIGASLDKHQHGLFYNALDDNDFEKASYYLQIGLSLRQAFTQREMEIFTEKKNHLIIRKQIMKPVLMGSIVLCKKFYKRKSERFRVYLGSALQHIMSQLC